MENTSQIEEHQKSDDEIPNFELDSIELATPQLFSDDQEIDSFNQENKKDENALEMFEVPNTEQNVEKKEKEQEMFEQSNSEEDFEIPAFLRRQKN